MFKPIFDLQTRARTKSLGVSYWSSASKKRAKILSGDKDVFELAANRLQAIRGQPGSSPSRSNILSGSPVRKLSSSSASSLSATDTHSPKIPEQPSGPVDKKSLETWIQVEANKEPLVQAYVTAFSQAYVAEARLKEQSQKALATPSQDQLLLDLRYTVAVSTKSTNYCGFCFAPLPFTHKRDIILMNVQGEMKLRVRWRSCGSRSSPR